MRQAERRARTTRELLDAAAGVFARRGFHAATLDEVAEAAGYTKGAVYGNFAGKDGLFLALLDRHLDDQVAQLDRLLASGSDLPAVVRDASVKQMEVGGSFGLLTLEFWLYAARNPEARSALAERYRDIRARLADVLAERDAGRGLSDTRAPDEAAALVLAMDAGLFLQHLIDPEEITPELRARAITEIIEPGRS